MARRFLHLLIVFLISAFLLIPSPSFAAKKPLADTSQTTPAHHTKHHKHHHGAKHSPKKKHHAVRHHKAHHLRAKTSSPDAAAE